MLGKEKCRILKQIRQRIADENDIPYVTRECTFRGECKGTCPRCESELRYLERELALRASLGKRVAVAALCASLGLSAAGCSPFGGRTPVGGDDLDRLYPTRPQRREHGIAAPGLHRRLVPRPVARLVCVGVLHRNCFFQDFLVAPFTPHR